MVGPGYLQDPLSQRRGEPLVKNIHGSHITSSLYHGLQDHLPGYVQKLVEFRLLLYSTRGITSFSTHVAVSA